MTTRIIQKNTLSFTCSKSMKYLRTPVDIWDTLKDKYNFTIDLCASDINHLLPRYYTKENDALKQRVKEHLYSYYPLLFTLNTFMIIFTISQMWR